MINVRPNRRGIALVLVTFVIALATVMGMAMLSNTMMQKRVANNADRAAKADGLAESGLNLAMYYLTHTSTIPGGGTYWAGTGGADVALGSLAGTVNVLVTPAGVDGRTYEIVSIGKSGSASDIITRTRYARVQSNKYVVRQAGVFNQSVSLPLNSTIDGDVATNVKLTLVNPASPNAGSVVNGSGYCTQFVSTPKPRDGFKSLWTASALAPSTAAINTYHTYLYNGVTYSGEALGSSTLSVSKSSSAGTNPQGVFYRTGGSTLILTDNVAIDGTLVVEGNLSLQGTNITITAHDNMPAVVVTGWLEIQQAAVGSRTVTINGVCYVGSQLRSTVLTASTTQFNIYGALLVAGSTPFNANYKATTYIKLDPTKIKANDLSTTITSPTSVSVVRWGPNKTGG